MEIFDRNLGRDIEQPEQVKDFLEDIRKVYLKHHMSISLDSTYYSFIINPYDPDDYDWLKNADIIGFNKRKKVKNE